MSILRKHLMLGLGLGLALGVAACADSDESDTTVPVDDEANLDERPNPLAEVNRAGNTVRFYEPEPGYIVTVADHEEGRPLLASAELRNKNALEIYETLAGSSAPKLLRAAFQRLRANQAVEGDATRALPEFTPRGTGNKAILSAFDFQEKYCTEFTTQTCDTDKNAGKEWGPYRTGWLYGVLNPLSGSVGLQIRMYKTIGGWRNIVKEDVAAGREKEFFGEGGPIVRRDHKVKVEFVDPGERYHIFFTR